MDYVLTNGHTRFAALKQLGWTNIPCYIKSRMEGITLQINNIKILDKENSRLDIKSNEVKDMMLSIQATGLLQPLGVESIDTLTKTDYISINVNENIHRNDLSPFEVYNKILQLQEMGNDYDSIATILSLKSSKIKEIIRSGKNIPIENIKELKYKRNGVITPQKINLIYTRRLKDKGHSERLLTATKKYNFSEREIDVIVRLLQSGVEFDEAIEKRKIIKRHDIAILAFEDLFLDKIKKENCKSGTELINKILRGKIKLDQSIFFGGN